MTFGIIGLFALALVSAAVLTYFGLITGVATVTQSVVLTGVSAFQFDGDTNTAGKSFTDCGFSVKNNAEVEAPLELKTICVATASGNCDGVTTEVYGILELTQKNIVTWEPLTNGETATIHYTIVGDEFVVSGIPTGYTLIYYPNTAEGYLNDMANTIVLNEGVNDIPSLPISIDIGDDYCNILNDNQELSNPNAKFCSGAKLWLIPGTTGDINWGVMGTFLYETDLIVYSNTNDGTMTLQPGAGFDFCVDNDFALNLVPDTYTIDVSIVPQ